VGKLDITGGDETMIGYYAELIVELRFIPKIGLWQYKACTDRECPSS